MKIILLLFLAMFTCCSCVLIRYDDYTSVMNWVHDNISYKYDTEDIWQPPEITTELKTGDCEDLALLMLRMVHDTYGVRGRFVTIREDDAEEVHAIVEYDIYYDPTNNISYEKPEQDIVYVLSYNTAMNQAERNYED